MLNPYANQAAARDYQSFPGIRPMAKTEAEKAVYEAEAAYEVAKSQLAVERSADRLKRAEQRLEEIRAQPIFTDQEFAGAEFEKTRAFGLCAAVTDADLRAIRALD